MDSAKPRDLPAIPQIGRRDPGGRKVGLSSVRLQPPIYLSDAPATGPARRLAGLGWAGVGWGGVVSI